MAHLGRVGFEELSSGRDVAEEVSDLDGGADLSAGGARRCGLAGAGGDFDGLEGVGSAAGDSQVGDGGDGGERFASEPEGRDSFEVLGGSEFAGCVSGEGEGEFRRGDAGPIVAGADEFLASFLEFEDDACGLGVDGVFEEFLDDAGRPLDDLAGGDLVDQGFGQNPDRGHRRHVPYRPRHGPRP